MSLNTNRQNIERKHFCHFCLPFYAIETRSLLLEDGLLLFCLRLGSGGCALSCCRPAVSSSYNVGSPCNAGRRLASNDSRRACPFGSRHHHFGCCIHRLWSSWSALPKLQLHSICVSSTLRFCVAAQPNDPASRLTCVLDFCCATSPDNDAFAALDQDLLAKLLTAPWILHLQDLLAYHATTPSMDRVLAADLMDGMSLEMLNNENTTVAVDEATGSVSVGSFGEGSSNVISADNIASNGNVHIVDTVLTPSFLVTDLIALVESTKGYSILAQLVKSADLTLPDNMDFTLLAPNDSA